MQVDVVAAAEALGEFPLERAVEARPRGRGRLGREVRGQDAEPWSDLEHDVFGAGSRDGR